MTRRTRRIVGAAALTAFVLAYIVAAAEIGAVYFAEAGVVLQVAYFAVAGIAWTVPAGLILMWMRRPGADPPEA